jgi:hypothetical protein
LVVYFCGIWETSAVYKRFKKKNRLKGGELLLYAVNTPLLNFGTTSEIELKIAGYVPLSAIKHLTKNVAVAPLSLIRLPELVEFCQPSSA